MNAIERVTANSDLSLLISCLLSTTALERSLDHQARFTALMITTMTFVMTKLGAKGVFHNTLLFSGRFLVGLSDERSDFMLTRKKGLRILQGTSCWRTATHCPATSPRRFDEVHSISHVWCPHTVCHSPDSPGRYKTLT